MSEEEFQRRLRGLVGRRCRYLGRRWRVVEVLMGEGKLILEEEGGEPPIQSDQYRRPLRRLAETIEISLGEPGSEDLSGDCLDILESIASDPDRGDRST